MSRRVSSFPLASFALFSGVAVALACGGSEGENSGEDGDAIQIGDEVDVDGDGTTDGTAIDTDGDGEADAYDADGDGEPDGSLEPPTAGDGDGDDSGGDGDTTGDGDNATGGQAGDGDAVELTGPCYDEPCGGNCAPLDDAGPVCGGRWECQQVLACNRDIASYCGCDGETIMGSSNCVSLAYSHEGPCDGDGGDGDGAGGGIAGGLNCDGAQVVTDELPPECDFGQIPEVVGGSWGSCVPLGDCGCDSPGSQDQCGDGLSYICYNENRCGDLVN